MTATKTSSGRILVVKLSSLGDALHALPAAAEIRDRTGLPLDWAVQPEFAGLVGAFSCVDRVITVPRPSRTGAWFRALRDLRRGSAYSLVLDMQGLLKSAVVARAARLAPGGRIVGPSFAREGSRFFYHELAGKRDKNRHAVEENFDVLRHLGIPVPEKARFPLALPQIPPEALAALSDLTAAGPIVAVAPFSRWESKNWSPKRFSETIRLLVRRLDARVALIGGPADAPGAAAIVNAAAVPAANMCGKLRVMESAALLSRSAALLTNDSGPMHIAAALGVPCVAPFGPTAPGRTGPWGDIHRVLRAPDGTCGRAPCRRKLCPLGTGVCLERISAEDAFRAVAAAVEASR